VKIRLDDRRLLLVIVPLLAVVVIYNVRHFTAGDHRRDMDPGEERLAGMAGSPPTRPAWVTGDYDAPADWAGNPFSPGGAIAAGKAASAAAPKKKAPVNSAPVITGIGRLGDRYFVLAGDRILRVGDSYGEGTVKEISEGTVVVDYRTGDKIIEID
jgi:hypothetical protein